MIKYPLDIKFCFPFNHITHLNSLQFYYSTRVLLCVTALQAPRVLEYLYRHIRITVDECIMYIFIPTAGRITVKCS